jgi:starvation-inducible DNA-binding protein
MTTPTTLYPPKNSNSAVSKTLQEVLASTYGLYLATHNYHWNVEGSKFLQLHALFESQYKELFLAIDAIAERIRALGDYALPFEGENVLQVSKLMSNALNKETAADDRAHRMVQNLIELNEAVVKTCQASKKVTQSERDDESENLMVERITVHQKAMWMLGSVLKVRIPTFIRPSFR